MIAKDSQARGGKTEMIRFVVTGQNQMASKGWMFLVGIFGFASVATQSERRADPSFEIWQWPCVSDSQMFHQMVMTERMTRKAL